MTAILLDFFIGDLIEPLEIPLGALSQQFFFDFLLGDLMLPLEVPLRAL